MIITDRSKDVIKSGGEWVSSIDLENVIMAHPAVLEAAVIGIPDDLLGQAVKAFIVASDPALTKQFILAHCRRYLEDLMVPKYLEFRSELPKTSTGKINKRELISFGIAQPDLN